MHGRMMSVSNDLSPFGFYTPHGLVRRLLLLTRHKPLGWLGRRFGFVCRAAAMALLRGKPLDVESLGVRMRLYPAQNVSEKNLLFTPHLFDPEERRVLQQHIHDGFTFIDIGANVGGYALFVAALAGAQARILAIEPQPEIFERLAYNVRQNPFGSVKALECAVIDRDEPITLFVDPANRGQTSTRFVSPAGKSHALTVPGKTLGTILREEGFDHIDALKIDVEGAEDLILDPFFDDVDPLLWPRLLIVDSANAQANAEINALKDRSAYTLVLRTRSNDVYQRCETAEIGAA